MGGGAIIFAKMYCIKIHIKLCCITLKMVCKLLFMYQNKVKVSNGPKKILFGVSGGLKNFGPLKNLINKCSYSHGGGRNYLHQPIPIYKIKNKGYRIQASGYRIQDTSYRIQDAGYRIQDTGYRIQDTGYRIQYTGYRIQDKVNRIK